MEAFTDIKLSLGTPNKRAMCMNGDYRGQDAAGLNFVRARDGQNV
jgi:hypothetical protein